MFTFLRIIRAIFGLSFCSQVVKRFLIFVICLGSPLTCFAQVLTPTQAQAREFLDFVCPRIQEIGQSGKNLIQMGAGITSRQLQTGDRSQAMDETVISHASHNGVLAFVTGGAVCDLARIYSLMTSAPDREFARGFLIVRSQQLVSQFDTQIQQINSELPMLRSPAAVSEAGKLRDMLQLIRDRTNAFTPPAAK